MIDSSFADRDSACTMQLLVKAGGDSDSMARLTGFVSMLQHGDPDTISWYRYCPDHRGELCLTALLVRYFQDGEAVCTAFINCHKEEYFLISKAAPWSITWKRFSSYSVESWSNSSSSEEVGCVSGYLKHESCIATGKTERFKMYWDSLDGCRSCLVNLT